MTAGLLGFRGPIEKKKSGIGIKPLLAILRVLTVWPTVLASEHAAWLSFPERGEMRGNT